MKINAKISGIASFVPDDRLTNDDIAKMVDTNDEWITTRVGIKERRILKTPGAGSSFMGVKAINKLLADLNMPASEIELIICATSNPDYRFPSTASVIAHECGAVNAYGYDIQAACAGFLVALQAGRAYICSGLYKKVIVVAAEKMTSMTDYTDRTTCPLFGDAAAAVLLEPTEENVGIIDGVYHVDGSGLPHLVMKAGGSVLPASHETVDAHQHFVYQEGRAVYKHAVTDMLESSLEVLKRNDLSIDSIDWFIPIRLIFASSRQLALDSASTPLKCLSISKNMATQAPLRFRCASMNTSPN